MRTMSFIEKLVLSGILCIMAVALTGKGALSVDRQAEVIFVVSWYDVGNEALEGLKGVLKVEKGFRHFREINTVYYDPKIITIEDMEKVLKKAGTYIETVK